MADILHVINGDDTLRGFNHTGLDGDVLVWREILSQGPLSAEISSSEFWRARSAWISETFRVDAGDHEDNFVKHLEMLRNPYREINIWFEFDLHCQVNMLSVMQLLAQENDLNEPAIYLICPNEVPGVGDFRGMGQLNGNQLEDLFDNRVRLNDYEFTLADEAWQLYVENDAEKLNDWLEATTFWGNLHLLKPAVQAHIRRITLNDAGLNYIEQRLADICNSGLTERAAIYEAFWKTEKIYGMGDAEINIYLDQLKEKNIIK